MNTTIRGHNFRAVVATVALAALLVLVALVFVLQQTATTGAGGRAVPAVSVKGNGGSSIPNDPFVKHHAEVVARYLGNIPDGSRLTKDPSIDRHAEIVARYHEGSLR